MRPVLDRLLALFAQVAHSATVPAQLLAVHGPSVAQDITKNLSQLEVLIGLAKKSMHARIIIVLFLRWDAWTCLLPLGMVWTDAYVELAFPDLFLLVVCASQKRRSLTRATVEPSWAGCPLHVAVWILCCVKWGPGSKLGYAVMVAGVAPMAMRAAISMMRARCSNVTRMWHHALLAIL